MEFVVRVGCNVFNCTEEYVVYLKVSSHFIFRLTSTLGCISETSRTLS